MNPSSLYLLMIWNRTRETHPYYQRDLIFNILPRDAIMYGILPLLKRKVVNSSFQESLPLSEFQLKDISPYILMTYESSWCQLIHMKLTEKYEIEIRGKFKNPEDRYGLELLNIGGIWTNGFTSIFAYFNSDYFDDDNPYCYVTKSMSKKVGFGTHKVELDYDELEHLQECLETMKRVRIKIILSSRGKIRQILFDNNSI